MEAIQFHRSSISYKKCLTVEKLLRQRILEKCVAISLIEEVFFWLLNNVFSNLNSDPYFLKIKTAVDVWRELKI